MKIQEMTNNLLNYSQSFHHHDAHFQEGLEYLKANVARLASLLKQALSFYLYHR
jgi:hypothetical protein